MAIRIYLPPGVVLRAAIYLPPGGRWQPARADGRGTACSLTANQVCYSAKIVRLPPAFLFSLADARQLLPGRSYLSPRHCEERSDVAIRFLLRGRFMNRPYAMQG